MLSHFNNMYIVSISVKHSDKTTYSASTKSIATGKF